MIRLSRGLRASDSHMLAYRGPWGAYLLGSYWGSSGAGRTSAWTLQLSDDDAANTRLTAWEVSGIF